ncbi:longitudinals lacking protein, isoforms A/B/D/L-like [Temnothorax curvispinosus]|uniref:Longitudinals lacking protein, isoforms A/B/D/L-like n=1 Tax=Temnothorax curvispinosus TaxID=300111 RepID=A0A6J1R5P8_9HYME|nr:longitudinals lacking protein, isoforms A/B/D/L-like [Temnothorax curvispinosus]
MSRYFSDNKESTPYHRKRTKNTKRTRCARFPCPNSNCRRVFKWKKHLLSHLRHECGQEPRFKCPYCDYVSKFKNDNVKRHIRLKHKNRYVYVIDIERNVVC